MSAFQVKPVLSISALLGFSLLIGLGVWQLQRLQWKNDLIATVEARLKEEPRGVSSAFFQQNDGDGLEFMQVSLSGVLDYSKEIHVFGTLEGAAGYFLFTPMRLEPDQWIYINRGFVPQDDAPPIDETAQDSTVQTFSGTLRRWRPRPAIANALTPAADGASHIWYERNIPEFYQVNNIQGPLYWVDAKTTPGTYPRAANSFLDIPNRHLEYALTWFGLAATLLVVFFAFAYSARNVR